MIYTKKGTNATFIDINGFNPVKDNKSFPVVSLFTGAGGMDIGLEDAGFSTSVCIENDSHCRETLKHNRPDWHVIESTELKVNNELTQREAGNIREVTTQEVKDILGESADNLSLVVGGAPCQPFSNIGKKEGKNDKKNGDLFLEFVRFVRDLRPKGFIFENVSGITQKKHSDVINYMLENFKGLGYGISYAILNSADYGVPQTRKRFFLIGLQGVDNPAFPLPTHFSGNLNSINDYIGVNKSTVDVKTLSKWVTVERAFKKLPKNYKKRKDYTVMNISQPVQDRMKYVQQGENFKSIPLDLRPNCWKNGKHQGDDTFGRLKSDAPSVTIRTAAYNPSKGRYIHPNENRGLDTIELAALQSFPYEWTFKVANPKKDITLASGGRQIGNAVPPLLAEAIGKALLLQLNNVNQFSILDKTSVAELSESTA
ncbi:DNA cytosine methyltransferase [Carboxylicivirga sp. RSCT41]|uniref:DNA cytosine methyltransferase n=1 Tax=Carboxylicivirga agarovorans TaxID=3417570 RepID=UPI003D355640